MSTPTYTPEQIEIILGEARQHIITSGGKKTPGVENRRDLIAIIEQLCRERDEARKSADKVADVGLRVCDERDAAISGAHAKREKIAGLKYIRFGPSADACHDYLKRDDVLFILDEKTP